MNQTWDMLIRKFTLGAMHSVADTYGVVSEMCGCVW